MFIWTIFVHIKCVRVCVALQWICFDMIVKVISRSQEFIIRWVVLCVSSVSTQKSSSSSCSSTFRHTEIGAYSLNCCLIFRRLSSSPHVNTHETPKKIKTEISTRNCVDFGDSVSLSRSVARDYLLCAQCEWLCFVWLLFFLCVSYWCRFMGDAVYTVRQRKVDISLLRFA